MQQVNTSFIGPLPQITPLQFVEIASAKIEELIGLVFAANMQGHDFSIRVNSQFVQFGGESLEPVYCTSCSMLLHEQLIDWCDQQIKLIEALPSPQTADLFQSGA